MLSKEKISGFEAPGYCQSYVSYYSSYLSKISSDAEFKSMQYYVKLNANKKFAIWVNFKYFLLKTFKIFLLIQLGAYTTEGRNFTWLYDGRKAIFDVNSWEPGNFFKLYYKKTVLW